MALRAPILRVPPHFGVLILPSHGLRRHVRKHGAKLAIRSVARRFQPVREVFPDLLAFEKSYGRPTWARNGQMKHDGRCEKPMSGGDRHD